MRGGARLLIAAAALAAAFVGATIALARAMRQTGLRDRIRRFNRRILNPLTLRLAGKDLRLYATIEHTGRRSGRRYATPVVVKPLGDGFVVPLPYGAGVDWYRNVAAAGGCSLVWNRTRFTLEKPELIGPSEALPAFSRVQRVVLRRSGMRQFVLLHRVTAAPEELPAGGGRTERLPG